VTKPARPPETGVGLAETEATELRAQLADARLYLCTGARRSTGDLAEFLDAVLGAGVDIVQLREKMTCSGPVRSRVCWPPVA
jgi:hypothetical protein